VGNSGNSLEVLLFGFSGSLTMTMYSIDLPGSEPSSKVPFGTVSLNIIKPLGLESVLPSLRSTLHDGPRLIVGSDNRIAANQNTELKEINPWCFTCERGVKMEGK
jgi:hypothetical protein